MDRSFFKVLDCHLLEAGGGYSPAHGVLLCRNQLRTVEQVHSTVLHELLHAYDDCRAQPQGGLDWTNCHQHACAEVRAAWHAALGRPGAPSRAPPKRRRRSRIARPGSPEPSA